MSKYFNVRFRPKPERTLDEMPTAELAEGINRLLQTLKARGVTICDYDNKTRKLFKIQIVHGRLFFLASEDDTWLT